MKKLIVSSLFIFCFVFAGTASAAQGERSLKLSGLEHDHVSIADADQSGLDIAGDMTMALWVKPTSVIDNMPLISKWNTGEKTQYILFLENGELGVHLNAAPSGFGYSTHRVAHGQSENEWFHVAMVYKSASGTTELFVNGQSVGIDTTAPTSISNTDTEFSIGGRDDLVTAFSGNIDEVRIWSRALTSNRINTLYQSTGTFNNGTDLQGFWKFNGNLNDRSVNKNHLRFSFSSDVPY